MLIVVSNECQPPTFTALLVEKSQCAVSNVSLEFHRVWGFLNQNLYILLCNTCLPVRTFHKKKRNRGRVLTGIYLSYIVDVKNNIFPLSWGHNVVSGRNHNFYFKILSWYSSQTIQGLRSWVTLDCIRIRLNGLIS